MNGVMYMYVFMRTTYVYSKIRLMVNVRDKQYFE